MEFDLPASSLSASHGARAPDVMGGESHTYTLPPSWAGSGARDIDTKGHDDVGAAETLRATVLASDFAGITLTF